MNDTTGVLWRRLRNLLSPQLDLYVHLAEHMKGKDVLEVGFGTGSGTLQLTRLAKSVSACEIDPEAVKFAKHVFPLNVTWFQHDIAARHEQVWSDYGAPEPPWRYDAIVSIETLEHIPDYESALRHMSVLLRDGGVAYISGPNANSDLRKTDLHEREWQAGEFRRELSRVFDNVKLYDYTLTKEQRDETTLTPLVAVCQKRSS